MKHPKSFLLLLYFGLLISCTKEDSRLNDIKNPDLTDIDGNGYKAVNIGTQTWLQQNLNVSHYNNGEIIPQVTNATDWNNLKTGAWCYYENDTNKGKTYGKLYNWYAVNDPRGLAPKGYKIPNKNDWDVLIGYLGGASIAGGKMKSNNLWHSPNTGGTNSSGFSASPGGIFEYGVFKYVGDDGFWWSGTDDADSAYFVLLTFAFEKAQTSSYSKKNGLAVRCIKETIQ
jgi:uncharacterized protein (TIGR02145 family)